MPPPRIVHNKFFTPALTLLLLGITFYVFVLDCSQRALLDFEVYTQAAKALLRGDNIYSAPFEVVDRWDRNVNLYYLYPPFLAQVLSKFLALSHENLKFAWCLFSFLCIVGSAACVAELVAFSWWKKFSSAQRFLFVYFFMVCFEPVYWGISDGQVTAVILLLLSIFMLSSFRGKEVISGVALGLAVLIKMSPILLILALLRFKRWKALLACIATCAAAVAWIQIDHGNLQPLNDFVNSLLGIAHERSSRSFLFNYVFDKSLLTPLGLDGNEVAACIVRAFLIALPLFVILKIKGNSREVELHANAMLLCFMMVCSPIIWFHHLAWALLPLAVLSCANEKDPQLLLKHLTRCVGLYFVISQVNLIHYWSFKEIPDFTWLTSLIPTVLLLLLAFCIWRQAQLSNE